MLTSEEDIKNYLDVEIVINNDRSFDFKQPHLIKKVFDCVKKEKEGKMR